MSDHQSQIYVKGFGRNTGEEELKKLCGAYGEVKEVRVIRDYAFVVDCLSLRCTITNLTQRLQSKNLTILIMMIAN
jgi:hypothetical protein